MPPKPKPATPAAKKEAAAAGMQDYLQKLGNQKKLMLDELDRTLENRKGVQKKVMALLEKSRGKLELALGLSNTEAGFARLERLYPHLSAPAKNALMDRLLQARNLTGITLWLTLSSHDGYRTTEARERTLLFLVNASREGDEDEDCSGVDFARFLVDHGLVRPEDWKKARQTLRLGPADEEAPVFRFMDALAARHALQTLLPGQGPVTPAKSPRL
jgi:hypothetical protein